MVNWLLYKGCIGVACVAGGIVGAREIKFYRQLRRLVLVELCGDDYSDAEEELEANLDSD